jgi:hypothetical protein
MRIFHPGRIENAKRLADGQPLIDPEAQELERQRRIAASQAALSALPDDETDEPTTSRSA